MPPTPLDPRHRLHRRLESRAAQRRAEGEVVGVEKGFSPGSRRFARERLETRLLNLARIGSRATQIAMRDRPLRSVAAARDVATACPPVRSACRVLRSRAADSSNKSMGPQRVNSVSPASGPPCRRTGLLHPGRSVQRFRDSPRRGRRAVGLARNIWAQACVRSANRRRRAAGSMSGLVTATILPQARVARTAIWRVEQHDNGVRRHIGARPRPWCGRSLRIDVLLGTSAELIVPKRIV